MSESDDWKFQVFRDPVIKDAWRVMYNGRVISPTFNSRGAAYGYMEMLMRGRRKPEYAEED
jgi:hypothetical protein